jgi:ADP-heptose:LPS heptosyltransferase
LSSFLVYVTGDRLGDALLKYPVLCAFRAKHPDAHITWVTGKRPSIFAGRLSELAAGLIDEIHETTGIGQSLLHGVPRSLQRHYDVVVSTESRLRDTVALRRLDCRSFISPAARFWFSTRKSSHNYTGATAYEQFRILMSLAGDRELAPEPRLAVPEPLVQAAADALPLAGSYVGLAPGAGGKSKIWPLGNFVHLAHWLQRWGYTPVFFLGPEETALLDKLREAVPTALFPESDPAIRALNSPLATVALARRLAFSVTNDSGGGHLNAWRCPTFARPNRTIIGAEQFHF